MTVVYGHSPSHICGGSRGSDHCACLTGSDVTGRGRVRKYVMHMRNPKLRNIRPSGAFFTGSDNVTDRKRSCPALLYFPHFFSRTFCFPYFFSCTFCFPYYFFLWFFHRTIFFRTCFPIFFNVFLFSYLFPVFLIFFIFSRIFDFFYFFPFFFVFFRTYFQFFFLVFFQKLLLSYVLKYQ